MATLPTNYVDDQLADSMGGRRHYNMTTDAYGTYLTDVTEYTQRGSTFAAAQINETNAQVNENTNAITNKLGKTDDTKNNTTTFTSADTSTSPSSFQTISLMTSGEKHSSLFEKLSQAIKNIRWLNNNKRTTGAYDTYRDTVTFSSGDSTSATSWTDVSTLSSGLTHAALLNRISTMMKNVRYLYNKLHSGEYFGSAHLQYSGSLNISAYSVITVTVQSTSALAADYRTRAIALSQVVLTKGLIVIGVHDVVQNSTGYLTAQLDIMNPLNASKVLQFIDYVVIILGEINS